MFRTNLITTTQTLNPVLAINSVAFKMLSNEKGFLSVEPRDYFTHTPNLMATAYFMVMVFPSLALMDFIVTLSTDTAP